MKKFLKIIGFGFLGLIVIGMFMGEDESTTTSTEQKDETKEVSATEEKPKEEVKKEFGVGQEVPVGSLSYVLNSVSEAKELKLEYMDTLTTQGKFVILDLTVKNNDKKSRYADSEMFRLVDSEGVEFSANSEADMYLNKDLGFFLQEVNPKMSTQGKVAFEVPADAVDLKLQVSSGLGWSGGEYEVINLQ